MTRKRIALGIVCAVFVSATVAVVWIKARQLDEWSAKKDIPISHELIQAVYTDDGKLAADVVVESDNRVIFQGKRIEDVGEALKSEGREPQHPVFIFAESKATFGGVKPALESLTKAGFWKICLIPVHAEDTDKVGRNGRWRVAHILMMLRKEKNDLDEKPTRWLRVCLCGGQKESFAAHLSEKRKHQAQAVSPQGVWAWLEDSTQDIFSAVTAADRHLLAAAAGKRMNELSPDRAKFLPGALLDCDDSVSFEVVLDVVRKLYARSIFVFRLAAAD